MPTAGSKCHRFTAAIFFIVLVQSVHAIFAVEQASGQAVSTDLPVSYQKLSDRVIASISDGPMGNSAAVRFGNSGKILIVDSHIAPRVALLDLKNWADSGFEKVAYVVNTHWHVDHSHGNAAYRDLSPDVRFLAHDSTRAAMIRGAEAQLALWPNFFASGTRELRTRADQSPSAAEAARLRAIAAFRDELTSELERFDPVIPDSTFTGALRLSDEVLLLPLPAHTWGDVVVFVEPGRIAITGDIIQAPLRLRDVPADVFLASLRGVRDLEATVFVPGHGPILQDSSVLDAMITALESLKKIADANRGKDKPAADLLSDVEGEGFLSILIEPERWMQSFLDTADPSKNR